MDRQLRFGPPARRQTERRKDAALKSHVCFVPAIQSRLDFIVTLNQNLKTGGIKHRPLVQLGAASAALFFSLKAAGAG